MRPHSLWQKQVPNREGAAPGPDRLQPSKRELSHRPWGFLRGEQLGFVLKVGGCLNPSGWAMGAARLHETLH